MRIILLMIAGGMIQASCQNNPGAAKVSPSADADAHTYETPCQELDSVDLEMLRVYKKIEQEYADDERFLDRLNMAQVYWIQYKNRHIKALYPKGQNFYKDQYGMTYNYCKCAEVARLTRLRTAELRKWLTGERGDCPSSIRDNKNGK